MLFCNDNRKNRMNRKGMSLVELIVVTVIIAAAASMAFPVYKIIQQRSKERRLKKVLTDLRAAISGAKSHQSTNDFREGFRTIARVKGMEEISSDASLSEAEKLRKINAFVSRLAAGDGYPSTPNDIWGATPTAFIGELEWVDDLGVTRTEKLGSGTGRIPLDMRFYRGEPIHPFKDWYFEADFRYVPVRGDILEDRMHGYKSLTKKQWEDYEKSHHPVLDSLGGVKDVITASAGMALDGSNTNDW